METSFQSLFQNIIIANDKNTLKMIKNRETSEEGTESKQATKNNFIINTSNFMHIGIKTIEYATGILEQFKDVANYGVIVSNSDCIMLPSVNNSIVLPLEKNFDVLMSVFIKFKESHENSISSTP